MQFLNTIIGCFRLNKNQTIDTAVAEQPIWIRMKGEPNPLPNTRRSQADLASGLARLYGDELADAHERVGAIAALAPNDPRNRAALGTVLAARGLLREAKQEYAISKAIEPTANLSAETGLATTDLDLQDFQSAEARVKDLIARYPESLEAQRLNRDWEAHNMAEWQIEAGYAFRPSTSAAGGEGFSVAKQIYSAPLHYNWRLFGSTFYAHEHEPSGEGNAVLKRYLAGVEYRDAGLIASLAPTYSDYHSTGRVGVVGEGAYALNDRWTVGGRGEVFARNTPLRALNAGVTANAIGGDVTWRQNEQRSVTMNGEYMPFSDGNNRLGFYGFYTERLWTHPVFKVEGVFNLAESQNSKDANRLYFNPSHDFLGLGGLKVTHKLYHRYETRYEHSVTLMPGAYWQEHYGTKAALTARYDQRFVYDETFEAGWGVNYTHQAFDGKAEDDVSLMFDLLGRF